jgi:hypothetical protein
MVNYCCRNTSKSSATQQDPQNTAVLENDLHVRSAVPGALHGQKGECRLENI